MKDKAAKSAYDKARYAKRHVDLRPKVCVASGCEAKLIQPRHGQRSYCSRSCLERAWYKANYVPIPRTYTEPEPLPAAYTGHQWLQMARDAVGAMDLRPGTEITDRYYDDMGEALLALMEGRDPKEAVIAYRKREFAARHLTQHIGDWGGRDSIEDWHHWESIMPTSPSAEDEAMERVA